MNAVRWLRRRAPVYAAIGAMVPKSFLAFQIWFWVSLVLNTIGLTILVFFWRAIYSQTETLAGLTLPQTLTYLLLAQVFQPLTEQDLLWEFGYYLREGGIVHQLLRPVSFQGSYYVQALVSLATKLLLQVPIALLATALFGLRWPADPRAWGAFAISAVLGYTCLFFFHWLLASLTFYTTEVWGLSVLVFGMALFFSGSLVPLVMMPAWLRTVVLAVPFAQSLAVPVNLLVGITPLEQAPRVWLSQLAWLAGLFAVSRLVFRVAVRKVTVQGG